MIAAFRTMYEMKAVKIVLGVKWIQFSVETFVASADAFTPFLMHGLPTSANFGMIHQVVM